MNKGVKSFKNKETQWIIIGFDVKISRCELNRLRLILKQEAKSSQGLVENPRITIYNTSFRNLDLKSGTEALISDCFLDGRNKQRPTLISMTDAKLSISNSTFRRFKNTDGISILHGQLNSSVTVTNSIFFGNKGKKSVIWLHDGGSIQITETSARSNQGSADCTEAEKNNFLRLENNINGSITNSSFHNNEGCYGASILTSKDVYLSVQNSVFKRNLALYSGGVIFCEDESTLCVVNSTFERNTATSGAVLFLNDNVVANISDSKLSNNSAVHSGGGVMAMGNSFLNVNNSHFEGNSARIEAGAISTHTSVVAVEHSTFVNNKAESGGAIRINFNATGVLSNTTFVNNVAEKGGAVSLSYDCKFYIQTSKFYNNSAKYKGGLLAAREVNVRAFQGGAIHLQRNISITINGSTFLNNKAGSGGAIIGTNHVKSSISNTLFSSNTAEEAGGAIYYRDHVQANISHCNFTFNKAYGCAAFVADDDIEMSINNSDFIGNEAKSRGGVGCGLKIKSLKINNSTLKKNQAEHATVLFLRGSLTLNIAHSKFGNNVVSVNLNNKGAEYIKFQKLTKTSFIGQALILSNITNATFDKSEFINSNAGAIFIDREVQLFITSCTFTNNSAFSGGAVGILSDSVVKVINSSFTGNSADLSGGALYCFNSTLLLINSLLLNNTAFMDGAVAVKNAKSIIHGCTFIANKARNAAAVNAFDSTIDLQHNLFFKNRMVELENELLNLVIKELFQFTLNKFEGGTLVFVYSNAYLFNNTFNENIGEEGSALFSTSSSVEIHHCDFASNGETKNISLEVSELENISATVWVQYCSHPLVIVDSHFKYNTAGTIYSLNCSLVISNSTFMEK